MDIRNVFMVINTFQIWFNSINPKIKLVHSSCSPPTTETTQETKPPNVNTSSLS